MVLASLEGREIERQTETVIGTEEKGKGVVVGVKRRVRGSQTRSLCLPILRLYMFQSASDRHSLSLKVLGSDLGSVEVTLEVREDPEDPGLGPRGGLSESF